LKSLNIIIVNWNSGNQLYDCLKSVKQTKKDSFKLNKVIVIDNNSADNSLDNLDKINIPLKIIKNKKNKGFAAACNQGAKDSNSDYLLFLNPDTKLFDESLSKSVSFIEKKENDNLGILGIQLVNENGVIQRTSSRFPSFKNLTIEILGLNKIFKNKFYGHFMKEWGHNNNQVVDQVMGAFFLVKSSLFKKIKGFDERFFVYYEEVDFSYRAKKKGFKSYYLSDVQAFHKGGGTSEQVKAARLFYSLRSRILYSFKHFSKYKAIIVLFMTLIIEPFTRSVYNLVLERSINNFKETTKGYYNLYKDLPNIFTEIKKH
jgi:hypothetical protein